MIIFVKFIGILIVFLSFLKQINKAAHPETPLTREENQNDDSDDGNEEVDDVLYKEEESESEISSEDD